MLNEAQRLAEWVKFVAACPPDREMDLQQQHVSTAFQRALAQGWTGDELAGDAVATFRRGGGVGAVVVRLETMSKTQRVTRSNVLKGPWQPPKYVPQEQNRIPPEWARERTALLQKCKTMTPDEAEEAMRNLIAVQQGRW